MVTDLNTSPQSGGVGLRIGHEAQDRLFARAFQVLREGIDQRAFPGAALAVVHQGTLVALKGIGHYIYDASSPGVSADCIWDLASVTKIVGTTAATMVLYERGLLRLDQRLSELMPQFGGDRQRERITIRMLLSHCSGLPAYVKFFQSHDTEESILNAAMRLPLEAEEGTRAQYSDTGFMLLGKALEVITNRRLDEFCHAEIFVPLGMTETSFLPPQEWRGRIPPTEDDRLFRHKVIQGEVNDENAWAMGGVAGHAGIFASALDVAKFAHCMLKGGAPILHRETIELFTRRELSPVDTSRALGWDAPSQPSQSGKHFSPRSFGHLGFTGTSLWCDPERQLAVTLLTNRTWPDRSVQLIKQIRPRFHDAVIECLRLT
jgi:serine-type D-Ala-D-Ala carboxypeptidase